MRLLVVFAVLATLVSKPALAQSARVSAMEQGIYTPEPPFENLKQSFYVRERERPLLEAITSASISIVLFLIDVTNATSTDSAFSIRFVLPQSQGLLRLPPIATFNRSMRYVALRLYCWNGEDKDRLELLIEWGDITTNARYTDSYIFVRREASWYFERHGSTTPSHWMQTERYFQRACPTISNE